MSNESWIALIMAAGISGLLVGGFAIAIIYTLGDLRRAQERLQAAQEEREYIERRNERMRELDRANRRWDRDEDSLELPADVTDLELFTTRNGSI